MPGDNTDLKAALGLAHQRWRRDPLGVDFVGAIEFTLVDATRGGHHRVVLTAKTVDWQAEEFLGRHSCHRLAAALHCVTGWDIITFDILRDGEWVPSHSAVRTPDGALLDIFGRSTFEDAEAKYRGDEDSSLRHRVVTTRLMPGDVLTNIDHLRGDPYWWAAEGPVERIAVLSHFARHLLTAHGYQHLAVNYPHSTISA